MDRASKDVAFYLSGLNDVERRALAVMLYFERIPDPHGDDTDQINTYVAAIDRIAEKEKGNEVSD